MIRRPNDMPLDWNALMNDEKVQAMLATNIGSVTGQHLFGVYLLLLNRAWFSDLPASLPDDDAILAGIARMDVSSWQTVKPTVMSPFRLSRGRWHQKKMRAVYDAVISKLKKFSEGGIATATKRWIDKPPDSLAIGRLQPGNRNRNESNRIEGEVQDDSIKGQSHVVAMNGKAGTLVELMGQCKELLGDNEMKRWHKRWLERAESEPNKLHSVLAEVSMLKKEKRISTTPAQAAEDLWKRWG